ncbi:hypothetical protein ACS0TY_007946 [Phlomoides rotata]
MEKQGNRNWIRGSCIGRGANATVNVGVQISDGRLFAVKSVDLSSALPSQVAALENEIAILRSLSSPFIVNYLGDDTTTEGSPATSFRNLHMEYLPTGTLADVAFSNSIYSSIPDYTWCLLSALGYLHARGITHCDVKGKNVLLGGSPGSARLADFGSASEISSVAGVSSRGSPLWMAPEVIRGEYQGPESDVWSLGCTVIEMVTGKPPWKVEAYSVYRIGFTDELPLFPAQLSAAGIDFLDKCLRRDYRKRWSCDQLLLHPFLSQRNLNIPADSSPRSVLDFSGSDFLEEEEIVNLGADERIRELASEGGANWESDDGWLVVRGSTEDGEGTSSEYSDLNEDMLGSEYAAPTGSMISNMNLVSLPQDSYTYSPVNDVAKQHNEPHHFYDNIIYPSRGSRVNRLYDGTNS